MPIGAYNPWVQAHCNPEQALRMALDVRAETLLPVHHQTFRLVREATTEPIERFSEVAAREKVNIVISAIGQTAVL